MHKTTFTIAKMDCPSEEQLIRMKFDGLEKIEALIFDLPNRRLEVVHTEDYSDILSMLNSLQLDTEFVVSEEVNSVLPKSADQESNLLWQVLIINLFFFVVEVAAGLWASSMGLIADSLDMLADSIVYGLSLYAIGRSVRRKKKVAELSAYFQALLAVLGFSEVIRRFVASDEVPVFQTMIVVSIFALVGNAVSLYLLQKSRSKEAHMQASMIFTSNDVIANLGVILAGILVLLTASQLPDLIIGLIVFAVVGRGAVRILQLSKTT